jgi:hypothetical protein
MGFPPTDEAIKIVTRGKNFDTEKHDFTIADSIWGPDQASLRGKTVKRPTPPAYMGVRQDGLKEPQILSVDVMFIGKLNVLVGVSYPLDLTLGTALIANNGGPSRTADAVKKGINTLLATLASQGYTVRAIMSDGEKAIGKLKEELEAIGIEIDTT